MSLRLLPPAAQELDEAIAYYNAVVSGLGDAFLADALRAFALIERFPDAWHPLSPNTRRHRLNRFPYGVIYWRDGDELIVVAVAHLHRQPEYWGTRLERKP